MGFRLEPTPPGQIRGVAIALTIIALPTGCFLAADQTDRFYAKQAVTKKAAAAGVSINIDGVTSFTRCGRCHFRIKPDQLGPLMREFRFQEKYEANAVSRYHFKEFQFRKGARVFYAPIRVPSESGGTLERFAMLYLPDTGDVYLNLCYAYG
jgi:hypothetical protein